MPSIEEIRRKRLEDMQSRSNLQTQLQAQITEQSKIAEQISMLENFVKQFMTKEAISRYNTLKIAHQELALQSIALIAQAAHGGQIRAKLTDTEYKEILRHLQTGKKEFKFLK